MDNFVYNLDDSDKEYFIVDESILDNTKYTFFAEVENPKNFCFRKTIIEDGEEYYIGLDDENEFNKVLLFFTKKNLK